MTHPPPFTPQASDEEIRREKARARALRASAWWKRKKSTGKCHYCGESFKPDELTMDHLIPLIRGGRSEKANLVPSCKECNNKKKNLLPMEWDDFMKKHYNDDELD